MNILGFNIWGKISLELHESKPSVQKYDREVFPSKYIPIKEKGYAAPGS